jgi:hypothetical protein
LIKLFFIIFSSLVKFWSHSAWNWGRYNIAVWIQLSSTKTGLIWREGLQLPTPPITLVNLLQSNHDRTIPKKIKIRNRFLDNLHLYLTKLLWSDIYFSLIQPLNILPKYNNTASGPRATMGRGEGKTEDVSAETAEIVRSSVSNARVCTLVTFPTTLAWVE